MKVILNKCYGGFGVSQEAYELYAKKKGIEIFPYTIKFKNGTGIYKKANSGNTVITTYLTKDFGYFVEMSDDDLKGKHLYLDDGHREDPVLIEVVEELGDRASGRFAKLVVVDIPDGMEYEIDDYDGIETLHQKVETW